MTLARTILEIEVVLPARAHIVRSCFGMSVEATPVDAELVGVLAGEERLDTGAARGRRAGHDRLRMAHLGILRIPSTEGSP